MPPRPIERVLSPFQRFLHLESSGGIVLLACTAIALVWANSPYASAYHELWHLELSFGVGSFELSKDLSHWISDGLMAVFFFLVGLEIKREVLAGELASPRKADLPVVAALGGMVVPAMLYFAVNAAGPGRDGWGVPMATDIAFAVGVMALLGRRVPLSLKVFITALAIADDLGAILIITIFYTDDLSFLGLGVAAAFLALMAVMNVLQVRRPLPYALAALGLWGAMLESGVHATIAGVLGAMTIPCWTHLSPTTLVARAQRAMATFDQEVAGDVEARRAVTGEQEKQLEALEEAIHKAQTPLRRLEISLHPWVSFVVMPLFALANAGVSFAGGLSRELAVPLGIALGLVVGKPVGIVLFSWLALRLGLAELPEGLSLRTLLGGGLLAGIGFTMSLFIANLAFEGEPFHEAAKLAILAASLVAGLAGALLLVLESRRTSPSER